MTHSAAAIVVAGGSGERFGRAAGKQLAVVGGRPVVSWALLALDAVPGLDRVVVVCPRSRRADFRTQSVEPLGMRTPVVFADAGETRQASVASGLSAIDMATDWVIIHDGARPLVTSMLVENALAAARESGADGAVVGHPSYDTLKLVEGADVVETVDRSRYWAVQTPQVFRRSALQAAHDAARAHGYSGTDDAALVEKAGGRVVVVEGPRDNLKVTVAEDLAFVQAVLEHREKGVPE